MSSAIVILSNVLFFATIGIAALASSHLRVQFQSFYFTKVIEGSPLSRHEYFYYQRLFDQHLAYFRNLSLGGQAKFISRTHRFMHARDFEGIRGLTLTRDMRALVSAAAVQISFGLDDYQLKFLRTIRIAPGPIYSRMFKGHMRGAVSPNGVLMVSWPDFLKGYANNDDNFNLGLHEMAHALKLNFAQAESFDLRFGSYINSWLRIGEGTFQDLQKRTPTYLHKYGGTNKHEFFAVCVEHFFETPQQFSQAHPDVYNHLCKLLNQNPLNVKGDYKLTVHFKQAIAKDPERIALPEKLKKRYSKDAPNQFHYFIIAGTILGVIAAVINASWEVLLWEAMMHTGAMGAALASIIQLPYIFTRRALGFRWMPFYLLALLILCTTSYGLLNGLFIIDHHSSTHRLERIDKRGATYYDLHFAADFEHPSLLYKLHRYEGDPALLEPTTLTLQLRRGCMGYDILDKVSIDFGEPSGD